MDQFQTLSILQMALNTNAIFTAATFFILWVAFRVAGKLREGEPNLLGKVLTTLFGLMIIYSGLTLFASRYASFGSATAGLKSIKASGQALGAQAEAFLSGPFASANTQFSLFNDLPSVIFWLVVTVLFLGMIWMPVSAKNPDKATATAA